MKQEIIAKLVKIATHGLSDSASYDAPYVFPYNYSDLEVDPDFDIPPEEVRSSFKGFYDTNEQLVGLPVNTDANPITNGDVLALQRNNPELYAQLIEEWYNLNTLNWVKKHEGAHRAAELTARTAPHWTGWHGNDPMARSIGHLVFPYSGADPAYDELPALVQEQLWNSKPGTVSFNTNKDGTPYRAIATVQNANDPSKEEKVDSYYSWLFPSVTPYSNNRKFYWTPRHAWVSQFGKVEEAPHEIDTLDAFQGKNRPLTEMPKPWQNTVKQLGSLGVAARQCRNDEKKYRAMQDSIYMGLTPLNSKLWNGYVDYDGERELPFSKNEHKNMAINPIPIGMANLQAKHYITPTFDTPSDVRTMQQMQDIQNDIDYSYKLDDNLRQNWTPLGGNSAGA